MKDLLKIAKCQNYKCLIEILDLKSESELKTSKSKSEKKETEIKTLKKEMISKIEELVEIKHAEINGT